MPAQDNRVLVRRIVDEVNKQGELSLVQQVVAPAKQAAAKQAATQARHVFPDLKITVEDTIAEGDKIAVRWTTSATHKGDAKGTKVGHLKASGKHVTVGGITILHIKDGKIVETWGVTDEAAVFEHLGLLKRSE